ncbi:hypothetical protein GCM10029992_06210 [Glycomyces albus]
MAPFAVRPALAGAATLRSGQAAERAFRRAGGRRRRDRRGGGGGRGEPGLRTALVEARDFASGTSSRSSKLVHGGLRYLEQLEVGLVREALTERGC